MRLGHIRFSAKWSKNLRKLPKSFLSLAGAPRRRRRRKRGTRALVASHDPLQLLLHYHQQQQDEEAEKGGSAGGHLVAGMRAQHKIFKTPHRIALPKEKSPHWHPQN